MEHIVEFWYEGECIEQRKYDKPPWGIPNSGDDLYMEFDNPNYSEFHGHAWTVLQRRVLMFKSDRLRTVQLYIEPIKDKQVRFG